MPDHPRHIPDGFDAPDPVAPPGLIRALHEAYGRPVAVPREVDEAILGMGQRRFEHQRRVRRAIRTAGWTAAAAVVGIAVWVAGPWTSGRRSAQSGRAPIALHEDIDRSGRVDILDAFAVARTLDREGAAPPQEWDINGDGVVDSKDVDTIAARAVRLNGARG